MTFALQSFFISDLLELWKRVADLQCNGAAFDISLLIFLFSFYVFPLYELSSCRQGPPFNIEYTIDFNTLTLNGIFIIQHSALSFDLLE